jgi:hypothetical protein
MADIADVAPELRDARITIRISTAEESMLTALADARGVTNADMVRMLIRDAHGAKFGDKPPKKKPRK